MNFANELALAKDAALKASAAILDYYKIADLPVTMKGKEQPLTAADLAANRIIKGILQNAFPDDGWLSEEDPDNAERFAKRRVWIVDPLDGTQDFINKNPEFAVSIGLVVDEKPVLGVIANPVTGEVFWAASGHGAFADGKRVTVTKNRDINHISLIVSQSENRRGEWERFKNFFNVTPTGGTAYKLALVASGRADGCFTLKPKSEWDICAGHALVTEAGGIITTASGENLKYNQPKPRIANLVYSNPHLHGPILDVIRKAPA